MSKILKNSTNTAISISDVGGDTVPANGQLTIDPANYQVYASSSDVIALLSSGLTLNNGNEDLELAAAVRLIQGGIPAISVIEEPTFTAKTVNGKALFSRTEGKEYAVVVGDNYLEYDITYPACKFNELEIIGGEKGDKVDLLILDSDAGTYSTIPNYPLNQFGFLVNVAADFYKRKSNYDADLYITMTILLKYNSVSAKAIYPNFVIHEVK